MKNYTTPGFGGIAEQLKAQLEAEAAEASGSELLCGVLFGVLTLAGTFPVHDEEFTGLVISMEMDDLRAAPRLPMYRRVAIVVAEDYERLDRYCSALEEQLDSIGLQKAQHIAGLSSPNAGDVARPGDGATPKEKTL